MDLLDDIAHTRFLPSYFHIVGQLLSLLAAENSDMGEIVRLVESDQSLASRTLTIVNSTYYGLPRQIGRLDEAVIFLGLNELRNTAIAVTMHDVTGGIRKEEWMHSLVVAHLADRIYRAQRGQMAGDLQKWTFSAGLLHDVGKLFLSRRYMSEYAQVLARVETGQVLVEAEAGAFGYDHAAVGGLLLGKWNLPERIVNTVTHHHNPEDNQLARIIMLADQTAHLMELPKDKVAEQVETNTGVSWNDLSAIITKALDRSNSFVSRQ